ncbi:hypothetical protein G6F40_015851 [Rhizopus arrhizus]|nr:hypothetical protein G6F40_015851 [Rhizopus arrhizus]
MPGSGGVYSDEDFGPPETARPDTLREHLLGQLMLTRAAPRDVVLAALLIDELDENGYLGSPLEEILGWLPADTEPDIDELRAALSLLQSFDPVGIGGRDMAECLLSAPSTCPCWLPAMPPASVRPWAATKPRSGRPTP